LPIPYILDMLGLTSDEVVGLELWEIGMWRDMTASQVVA